MVKLNSKMNAAKLVEQPAPVAAAKPKEAGFMRRTWNKIKSIRLPGLQMFLLVPWLWRTGKSFVLLALGGGIVIGGQTYEVPGIPIPAADPPKLQAKLPPPPQAALILDEKLLKRFEAMQLAVAKELEASRIAREEAAKAKVVQRVQPKPKEPAGSWLK